MSRSIQIDISFLDALKTARHGHDAWENLTNDAAFELSVLLKDVFNVDVTLMHDYSSETGRVVRQAASALDRAQRLLNYVLASMLDAGTHTCIDQLQRWLADASNLDRTQHAVIARVVRRLTTAVAFGDLNECTTQPLQLGPLVNVTIIESDDPVKWSSDEFDVFISYKHRLRSHDAHALRDQLTARGLRVWLDRDELAIAAGAKVRDVQIKRRLQHALSVSRHTVFFETVGEMHADEDFRGSHIAYSWQSFEQRYARDLIGVRANGDLFDLRRPSGVLAPANMAIEFLVARCRTGSARAQRSGFGPIPGRDPGLNDAANELRQHLEHAFGPGVQPTPLAEIALLAPGSSETGRTEAAYGDDVLIQLLRYDAASALELQRAGLESYWLFAAGTKLNDQRWQRPRELLVADVFGSERRSVHERVRRTRVLTVSDVLEGILEFAEGSSFPRILLRNACRAGRRNMKAEAVEGMVHECRARALKRLRHDAPQLGVHGWLFVLGDGEVNAVPLVGCGTIRLPDGRSSHLLARQSLRLFTPDAVAAFSRALTSRSAGDVGQVLATHEEIARTLDGVASVGYGQDVSRPGTQAEIWLVDRGADVPDVAPQAGKGLLAAIDAGTRQQLPGPASQRWPWGERPWQRCVLIAPVMNATPTDVSAFDLIADVLQPLDAYMTVRSLEYDDF